MSDHPDRSEAAGVWAWLQAAVILVAGGWVYWPAVRGEWLWDDGLEITQNRLLHNSGGWWKAWFEPSGLDYYPLKDSLQWVQWRLWGDHPLGYHLTNIGLHLLAAFLLWRLLDKLGVRLAWIGGLLFAVHPLAVESVAWISELKNALSLPLLLLAMSCYVDFDGADKGDATQRSEDSAFAKLRRTSPPSPGFGGLGNALHYYLWSLGMFLGAMLCKSSVVMFPVVLLLYAWWRRGRLARRDAWASLPFFALSLALGLVTVWFQQHRAIGTIPAAPGFFSRLSGAGHAIGFYFVKCIFPASLMPIYPRWSLDRPSLAQFLPWIAIAAVLFCSWAKRATWGRHALFGLGWFLLNLAPVLGFIPMAYGRNSWVADHFAYVSLVGVVGLAAVALGGFGWAAANSERPAGRRWFLHRAIPGLLVVAIAAALAIEAHRYARIFRDEESFWNYTVQRNPDAWLARNNLGKIALEKGAIPEAIAQLEAAIRLQPDSAEAHANLGNAMLKAGRLPRALDEYQEALRIDPAFAGAHFDLGSALLQASRPAEAISQFEEALRIDPSYAAAHNNWGLALARAGRFSEASAHYQAALELDPDFPEALVNLGNAFFNLGRLPEAAAQYRKALRINPRYAAAHRNLDYALRALGRTGEAKAEVDPAK